MTFYSCVVAVTELLMLAMILHVIRHTGFTKTQRSWYLLTFVAVMFCAAAEYAVHCGWYDPAWALPLTVLTVLQFSVVPMLAVLFSGALGLRRQGRVAVAFFVLNLVFETIAAVFELVFRFDRTGYARGDWFFLYSALFLAALLYLIVNMVIVGKRFRHRDGGTIVMILVVLAAGIVPMTLYSLHITYIAIAISASLCYIYYNDLVQQDIQAELVANQEQIAFMQEHIISGMANLIESRDVETGEHVFRTSAYVETLSKAARADGVYTDALTDHFVAMLRRLAPLHDVGKILVPDSILKKPGPLTPEEFDVMKRHAAEGGAVVREILGGIADEAHLNFAADLAAYHHERWDGSGYPKGLRGEEIPLSARIMALVDVYDALTSDRCYKKALPPEEAFRIIREEAGAHFDPKLAQVFLAHRAEFEENAGESA